MFAGHRSLETVQISTDDVVLVVAGHLGPFSIGEDDTVRRLSLAQELGYTR